MSAAEDAARQAQHWRDTAQAIRSGRQAPGFGDEDPAQEADALDAFASSWDDRAERLGDDR